MEAPGPARGTGSNSLCAFIGTSLLPPDAQTENLWCLTSYELYRAGCCIAHYKEKSHFATKTEKRHYYKKSPINQSTNRKQGSRSCSICFLSCTVLLLNKWDGILEHSQSFVAQNSIKSCILGELNFCSEVYRSQPRLQWTLATPFFTQYFVRGTVQSCFCLRAATCFTITVTENIPPQAKRLR